MCLIAFAINASSQWPLVVASNRDESFERPTLPLQRWETPSGQTVVSGRDVHAGGTWLGTTPGGRIAFLTNVRERPVDKKTAPRSRGDLVIAWLQSQETATDFMSRIEPADYGPFNLVVGDWSTGGWTWMSNRPDGASESANTVGWRSRALPPGLYGLSNAALDTPWPKTLALKQALNEGLRSAAAKNSTTAMESPLWQALASRQQADAELLPQTGVPLEMERALSSAFVHAPERAYGTRCSTLLFAESDVGMGAPLKLRVQEQTFGPSGQPVGGLVDIRLSWPA
ncbi:MAG: NRDE family protein [Pseudomonadota bacterium]